MVSTLKKMKKKQYCHVIRNKKLGTRMGNKTAKWVEN